MFSCFSLSVMIQTQYIIIERQFVLEAGVKVGGKEYGEAEGDSGRINILITSISVSTLIIRVVFPQI